jgi:hypothetical protein
MKGIMNKKTYMAILTLKNLTVSVNLMSMMFLMIGA